jgi:hypothetical protein
MIYTYTVITNNFDNLRRLRVPVDHLNERFVCFTDRPRYCSPWLTQPIPHIFDNPRDASRIPKMLPHLLMPDADVSIYMDGAFSPQISGIAAATLIEGHDIGIWLHPVNKSIHDEYNFYKTQHGSIPEDVERIYKKYVDEGIPITGEFYAGGLIIRRHNDKVAEFNELWMKEYVTAGSDNDQFSLYYALTKVGLKVKIMGEDNLWDKRYGYNLHAREGGLNVFYNQENGEWDERYNRIKEICDARKVLV